MNQEELTMEAKLVSDAILERLTALEKANGKSWIKVNWFSLISLAVLIAGLGVGWGTMREQIRSSEARALDQNQAWHQSFVEFTAELAKDEIEIKKVFDDLNAHRRDGEKHIEKRQLDKLEKDIADVRALAIDILRNTRAQRTP